MLKNAKASPDFPNYLAYLFSSSQPPPTVTLSLENYHIARSAAAIMLKNSVKASYRAISDPSKTYIRSVILAGLQDLNPQIRSYAGNVITELVKQGGLLAWPALLPDLISLVENKEGNIPPQTQEGAIAALFKICEDNKKAMERDYGGQRPVNFLFPKLLEFTGSPLPKVRATALACTHVFMAEKSPVVYTCIDQILSHLFQLASDPSSEVRKFVCRSFTHVAETSPEKLLPHMQGLVDYTVAQQRNKEDPELALDATEFWLTIGEDKNLVGSLGPYLRLIVPALLEGMVYSEDDILRLEGEQEDAEEEDRAEDIKPVFATSKSARGAANGEESADGTTVNGSAQDAELSDGEIEEYEDFEDDDDDDDELEDGEGSWNLRKCSAAALDVLASAFHGPVFDETLPYLKENLVHADWPNREAAVLALGAIASGCMGAIEQHLPELTRYLLSLLDDKEAVVRQIACWTLGRYSGWAANLDEAGRQEYFVPIMEGILRRMLDPNKRVQEAAASAFANLEEQAKGTLQPYCKEIVQQFVKCYAQYKDRNMFILYDCVQTLAEHVSPALQEPEVVDLLMPALIQRWNKAADQSREMFPLLECLAYVAGALEDLFTPFAEPIFSRCIYIIHQNLEDAIRAENNPAMDKPDKDFLVTSLDLLSAIIQALTDPKGAELVAKSNPNMFELLAYCMKDKNNDVRQSAYALLGDCAIHIFSQLKPYLPTLLEILIAQLDMSQVNYDAEETGYSVVNNACWSLGEIAMRAKESMIAYVDRLLEKLGTILFADKLPRSLNENAAIALGRLGIGCPQQLAPHLASFAPYFLNSMRGVEWHDEKGHALLGFNNVIRVNPRAMEKVLLMYFADMADGPTEFWAGEKDVGWRAQSFEQVGFPRLSPWLAKDINDDNVQVLKLYNSLIPNFSTWLQQLGPERYAAIKERFTFE